METERPIHPDFQSLLELKSQKVIDLFTSLRNYVLEIYSESNELLYHTHALTAVFSISEKLSDAFCHIPVYKEHLNLGFNKGTLLKDPNGVLQGTGKLIRHIEIQNTSDYQNATIRTLIEEAIAFSIGDMDGPVKTGARTISKIKK